MKWTKSKIANEIALWVVALLALPCAVVLWVALHELTHELLGP